MAASNDNENKTTDLVLSRLNVEEFYASEGLDLEAKGGDQFLGMCPFHEDTSPSLSVGPRGVFYCFACKASGNPFQYYQRQHNVDFKTALGVLAEAAGVLVTGGAKPKALLDDSEIPTWQAQLLKNPTALKFLHEERGYTDATIAKFKLGWSDGRLTIPIYDETDQLVNVRKYRPHSQSVTGKVIGVAGYNNVRLFPPTFKRHEPVVIVEGEPDRMLMDQEGFNAVTATLGAGMWDTSFNELFRGCDVIFALDHDQAGLVGADRILRQHKLIDFVKSARVVAWPADFREKGDVTDYLVAEGHSRDELQNLLDAAPDWVPPPPDEGDHFALTDVGNAKRLVSRHTENIRYVHLWKTWVIWDQMRWKPDRTQAIAQLAEETVLSMRATADPIIDKDLAVWSLRSESNARIQAMLELAQSEPAVAKLPSDFDQQPLLFACANGVIDLATGTLREARRDDYLTKGTTVPFDPTARSEAWEKLLYEITGADADFAQFLQRAVGYSLTGSTIEEKLFFVHGPTSSGKSTFLEAVKGVFGDYAVTANFASFLENKHAGEQKGDIARLAGARFVVSIEVEEGKKLAEGLIKTLTGGDKITARFLYQEAFEFMLNAKLWLAANHKPRVSDEDDAIWRRIMLVPFEHTILNPNPAIKKELLDTATSGPAILAWMVEGCLMWQRDGLGMPAKVLEATRQYRTEQNPIADWMAECVIEDATSEVFNSALYQSYLIWARENGLRFPITAKALAQRLNDLGYKTRKGHANKLMRQGLKLGAGVSRAQQNESEEF